MLIQDRTAIRVTRVWKQPTVTLTLITRHYCDNFQWQHIGTFPFCSSLRNYSPKPQRPFQLIERHTLRMSYKKKWKMPSSFCFLLRQITLRIVGYHFSSWLTATHNLCLIYFKITWALAILLEHMHKKFKINRTKIKGGCQSGRKVVTHHSNSDLPLVV